MACCLALALAIGALRTGWFRIVRGTEPPRAGFAPPARRPAPGTGPARVATRPTGPDAGAEPGAVGTAGAGDRREAVGAGAGARAAVAGGRSGAVVDLAPGVALGAGAYAALLALLAASGVVTLDPTVTGPAAATARTTALIAAAVLAGAVRARRPAGSRTGRARELAGGGAAWSLLSVLDMHVTGLVPEHLVGPLADLALHGPGFLAVTVGGGALLAGPRYLSTLIPGEPS